MSANESLAYEEFVQKVVESLVGVDVFHGREFEGRISGRKIKVDVSFELQIAGGANMLVLVECKHYKHSVPVDDVEEFHSKIDDIGAHKGILITTVGFQNGAVKAARGRRIGLALLTENQQPGEIAYIVNYATKFSFSPKKSTEFFQGNIRCLLSTGESGMRFTSFSQVVGMLIVDSHAETTRDHNDV